MTAEFGHAPNRTYEAQDGSIHINGGAVYDDNEHDISAALNGLSGSNVASFTMTPAAATTNVCEVTITAKDGDGNTVADVVNFDLWLSDAATGAGLTATTASGAVTNKTSSGAVIGTYTAKMALRVQTLATGVFILSITDTAKTGFVVCAQAPANGKTIVGATLTGANYG